MRYISREKAAFALLLLIIGVFYRFVPHPPNFSPLAAIALFGGFYFRKMRFALIPVAILFLTDIFLGFYQTGIMLSVYFSFILIAFLGIQIRKKTSLATIIGGSLLGSILFFFLTNFSVWIFGNWYAHNFSGLTHCFYLAIPFFRNTLLGDLFFSSVFFGIYEASQIYITKRSIQTPSQIGI